ncbi:MAG: tyrosine-type recombinase/integrase [Clostridia bacterium]|nr:tyrosine-type recombinase/integrase [Clostridia bacterium]
MFLRLQNYADHLAALEKSGITRKKYQYEAERFELWLAAENRTLSKESVIAYKEKLSATYQASSVNTKISALNTYFGFLGRGDCRTRAVKIQHPLFVPQNRVLLYYEYDRLIKAANKRKNPRLALLLQTICGLGLRVSEVQYITVEAIEQKTAVITNKGKTRIIPLPNSLCRVLARYITDEQIKSGPVFITKGGLPLDRSNIWRMMKSLARRAGLPLEKIYPHNLRHLFARTFYAREKDVVRLADILGHSSIDTTRIYTRQTGEYHRSAIEHLGLFCREDFDL